MKYYADIKFKFSVTIGEREKIIFLALASLRVAQF